MILLQLTQHVAVALQHATFVPTLPQSLLGGCSNPSANNAPDKSLIPLLGLLALIRSAIVWIGGTAFVVSIAIAGVMRMTAYGNERRIALSNMAMTAAVVGLVIMLLAQGTYTFITDGLANTAGGTGLACPGA